MTTDAAPTPAPRRRGRPANSEHRDDARSSIVAAAAAAFARDGFEATSMRGVAREAGVDPALVRHYFHDKATLFAEAVTDAMTSERLLASSLAHGTEQVGESMVRHLVTRLDEPGASVRTVRVLHTALGQEFAADDFRNLLMDDALTRIAEHFGSDDVELRASLVAADLLGLITARYGLRIEPFASEPAERVVALLGPVVQRHLESATA